MQEPLPVGEALAGELRKGRSGEVVPPPAAKLRLHCPQVAVVSYHLAQTSTGPSSLGSTVLWGKRRGEGRRSGLGRETGNLAKKLTAAFWQKWINMAWRLTLFVLLGLVAAVGGARAKTDMLNVCMDAKHHKPKPSPEDKLHDQVRREKGLGLGRGLAPKREEGRGLERAALGVMEAGGWLR